MEPPPQQILNPAGFGQQQPIFNTQPLNPVTFNPPSQPPAASAAAAVVEKPQPVEKTPIPDENVIIQTIFDNLRNKCIYAANNPVSGF